MDIEYLREAVSYDPETGEMRWGLRPKDHFATTKGYNLWKTRYAGKRPGSVTKKGYIRIPIDGTIFYAHRLAWILHYGENAPGQLDHINGDPADNRIANLRVTDNVGNARNKKLWTKNRTGHFGVSWRPDLERWSASIGVGGKNKNLGFYDTKDEAIAARRGAEIVLGYHKNHGRSAS